MKPRGQTTAFFNAEFHVFFICGGGGYGEHGLTHSGNGKHGALSGNVLKAFAAFQGVDPEGLNIGSVDSHVGNHADMGNKSFVY